MKINRFPHLQIITFIVLVVSFISCEKDAADLGSDIINPDVATNFDILIDSFDIISYTRPLGPVQTNNLGLNMLGIYDDVYGRTSANFVTQVGLDNFNPDFGDNTVLDSVVLTIPYFSSIVDVDEETGEFIYGLDSVFGDNDINLRIFENNYFLRDFDPNERF